MLLCHNNVTVPVKIGDTENSGFFDTVTPVTLTLHWAGQMEPSTQYLGRYEFAGQSSLPPSLPLWPVSIIYFP